MNILKISTQLRTLFFGFGRLASIILVYVFFASDVVAQEAIQPQDTVAITLVNHPEADVVDVVLHCDQATCDAVALQIIFNPVAVQVVIVSKGDFWLGSSNPVHILRKRVDNEQGLVEFMYVTENQGGEPVSGTNTLLTLGVVALTDTSPDFEIISAEIAALDGTTVLQFEASPSPILTPTPTATPEPRTVIVQVQLEAAPPEQITARSVDNANIQVIPMPTAANQAAFEIGITNTALPAQQVVIFQAPAHLSCEVNMEQDLAGNTITLRAGDINGDGMIDINDTAAIGMSIHTGNLVADVNRDNQVNILDLIHVGRNYGAQTGACAP